MLIHEFDCRFTKAKSIKRETVALNNGLLFYLYFNECGKT